MASALSQAKQLAKYNNQLEQKNVALQYSYNKSLAEQDRSWQERMANSAHQREIKDLKAAGLNPVLSITGGNGAATPSGSSASVGKPSVDMSLPSKVMDMAIAQLNSATALQTTAMNNANALQVVYDQGLNALSQIGYTGEQTRLNISAQGEEDRETKRETSGDSISGQVSNWKKTLERIGSGIEEFDSDLEKHTGISMKKVHENSASKRSNKSAARRSVRYWQKREDQTQLQLYKLEIASGKKLKGKAKREYKRLLRKYG